MLYLIYIVHMHISIYFYLFNYLSILSISLSTSLSIHLSFHLSIHLSFQARGGQAIWQVAEPTDPGGRLDPQAGGDPAGQFTFFKITSHLFWDSMDERLKSMHMNVDSKDNSLLKPPISKYARFYNFVKFWWI